MCPDLKLLYALSSTIVPSSNCTSTLFPPLYFINFISCPCLLSRELYMLVNGITARVCEYADIEHVTVELNTGEIVSSVHYKTLQNGSLGKDWKLKNGINYRSGAKKS